MHKQKRTSVISLGHKALSVAVTSTLLLMSNAHATGMGRLTVLSALGQPLRAEIELTSPNRDEIDTLVPKLASADAFRQANIDFNNALLSLRFAIEPRGAGYVIKVSSAQPINEPFVDMLLEITSSNGKLLREYTFLLDPAELRNSQSPQVTNPNVVVNKGQFSTSNQTEARPSSSVAASASSQVFAKKNLSQPAQSNKAPSDEYAVKPGDTLGKIAASYKQDGVSLDQMLVGLYRANPQAFAGKNMNRLKAGQILSVPDAETVRSTAGGNPGAHSVVVAHAADFNAYRNHLADYVEHAPAAKQVPEKQSAGGAITAKVKELPTATNESADKLKLSKAAPSPTEKGGNGKGVSEEEKVAKKKATEEAANRLKELEKNVGDLQRLLDVKNKDLAAKEAELNAKGKDKQVVASAAAASMPAPAAKAVGAPASSAVNVAASAPASSAVVAAVPASEPKEKSVASAADASASAASVTPVKPKRHVVAPPPPPEPSFFDSMSDWLLPGGGVLLALLAGAGVWMNRRKKKLQQFEDSILTGSSMKANSMFGSTGGQSVDTNNSVFNSNFAPSASQLDANEVDPVAEADVYIAYGRDSQAEEILKEALRTQPDRHAVRLKLLEIYFARKDAKLFERLAGELYGMTSGQGDEWAQAASMGIVLEPGNPLYAGGKAKTEMVYGAGLGSPTQPLEDLDPDALLGNSLSRDMLDAISIIDTASHGEAKESGHSASVALGEHVAESHDVGLDFDLGIGEVEVPQIPESPSHDSTLGVSEQIPEVDFGSIDFDFGESKPVDSAIEQPVHQSAHLASDGEDLHALDFAEPKSEVPAFDSHFESEIPVVAEELKLPLEDDHHDAHEAMPEASSAFEFDLSGISLDLPSDASHVAEVAADPVVSESPAVNAEMATKLDLAVAYHEIGDKEGARELLDEVLKGGTAEQKERAGTMLAQMA
ncbi:FimV/HubP family polar landmark protein [Undibacterium sp. Dicai25W]|uniref:FimV/HubP family polar landmark protein n=1 Tax=Undibacterium sp. Dicai25W TaxID=3413034 RepID=UPI003BF0F3FD